MREKDFCYWLQGYFELADLNGYGFINGKMIACIQKHLDLVKKYERDAPPFTSWVQGFVDAVDIGDDENLPATLTEKLKGELENMFAHEIDGSYESGDTEMVPGLNSIHGGKFRC